MFEIPSNLRQLTEAALRDLRVEATAARDSLVASVTRETVSDDQLTELENLQAFEAAVDTELASRVDRAARFTAATAVVPVAEPVVEAVVEPVVEPEAVVAAAPRTPAPTIAEIAATSTAPEVIVPSLEDISAPIASLVAAANVPGYTSGAAMTTVDLATVFLGKQTTFQALADARHTGMVKEQVAMVKLDYPEHLRVSGDNGDQDVLIAAANERNLPGGSLRASRKRKRAEIVAEMKALGYDDDDMPADALVAAGGWCAPSQTVYTTCFQTTNDGMFDTPEVAATRGGIRHNTGLDWSTVYGGGNILASAAGVTGFFNLTEAQVIAGSPTKTNIQVACPTFVDNRLGVTGLWITSPILTNRGYPEFVSTFMDGSMAVHAHQLNALRIQAVQAASTAVNLTANPYGADGSVTSNLLAAVEQAIVDLKYRLRLQRNATLEVVLPFWVHAQFRADFSRRTSMTIESIAVTDALIDQWFAMRGANVQFVYDWQDAFTSSTAGLPGAATAITNLPNTTTFLVYPTGTWVTAMQDVITLSAIYDSALLPTNMVTQLFMEQGWAMLQMCPVSRVYTVATCPSGQTTAAALVNCTTP